LEPAVEKSARDKNNLKGGVPITCTLDTCMTSGRYLTVQALPAYLLMYLLRAVLGSPSLTCLHVIGRELGLLECGIW
jgi:hypothetical protein